MQHLTLCKSVSFPSYIQTHIVHIKNWKIAAQRKFILERIRATTSKSDKVVHPPLPPDFLEDLEATAPYPRNNNGPNKAAERALAIPGVVEAGWTMSDLVSMTQNVTHLHYHCKWKYYHRRPMHYDGGHGVVDRRQRLLFLRALVVEDRRWVVDDGHVVRWMSLLRSRLYTYSMDKMVVVVK